MQKLIKKLSIGFVLSGIILTAFPSVSVAQTPVNITNTLSIPSIGVTQTIVESATIKGIGDNIWRRGVRSPEAGNMVLAAHRTLSIGGFKKGPFYDLPSVKEGDTITLVWEGKTYTYKVYERRTVPPSSVQIEFNTPEKILTLYTCVYSYSAKNRYMVRAILESSTPTQ